MSATHLDFEPKLIVSQMKVSPRANTLAEWKSAQEPHPAPATGHRDIKYTTSAKAAHRDGKDCCKWK